MKRIYLANSIVIPNGEFTEIQLIDGAEGNMKKFRYFINFPPDEIQQKSGLNAFYLEKLTAK